MTRTAMYTYLGTNGTITSPVHLEDIYYVLSYHLKADEGKQLTKDGVHYCQSISVPEDELKIWREVVKK